MTFFSHRPSSFACLYCRKSDIYHISIYDPFLNLTKIPSSHLVLITSYFSHASLNTTSPNIGRTDAWAVHPAAPTQILGGPSPIPPKSPPMLCPLSNLLSHFPFSGFTFHFLCFRSLLSTHAFQLFHFFLPPFLFIFLFPYSCCLSIYLTVP